MLELERKLSELEDENSALLKMMGSQQAGTAGLLLIFFSCWMPAQAAVRQVAVLTVTLLQPGAARRAGKEQEREGPNPNKQKKMRERARESEHCVVLTCWPGPWILIMSHHVPHSCMPFSAAGHVTIKVVFNSRRKKLGGLALLAEVLRDPNQVVLLFLPWASLACFPKWGTSPRHSERQRTPRKVMLISMPCFVV